VGAQPGPLGDETISLRRFILPGLFVLALFVTLWARRPEPPPAPAPQWALSGAIFGTTWAVKIIPPEHAQDPAALQAKIEGVLSAIDSRMSTYKADSELSLLNSSAEAGEVQVSAELGGLLQTSMRIYTMTGGAFDVTIGPLVNAWGFGPELAEAPSAEERTAALETVGSNHLSYESETGSLTRAIPGIYIDLSAIAKGYAVDQVAETIEELGHRRYLVEIGGEIRARGANRTGTPWSVGIETPDGGPQDTAKVLALGDHSLATSGNYRNLRLVDGRVVTHIIDPRSGEPVSHKLGSVSVLHPHCTEADALATALYVLGWDEGFEFAEREGIAALFLRTGGDDGSMEELATAAFASATEERGD